MIDDIIHKHPDWPEKLFIACEIDYFYNTNRKTYAVEEIYYSHVCDSYLNWQAKRFKGLWKTRNPIHSKNAYATKDNIVLKEVGKDLWRIEGEGVFRTEKQAYAAILEWFKDDQKLIQKRINSILKDFPELKGEIQ